MNCSLPRLLCPQNALGKHTGVGCCALLQGIFSTQGLNPGPLHCRQILYCLSQKDSPNLNKFPDRQNPGSSPTQSFTLHFIPSTRCYLCFHQVFISLSKSKHIKRYLLLGTRHCVSIYIRDLSHSPKVN